jgi:nucleoside-diphosphate-sugar epimerase
MGARARKAKNGEIKIMKESVIVTGGFGFLGSHLVEHYLKKNYSVIAVDNFCTGSRSNQTLFQKEIDEGRLESIEADVTQNWDSWLNSRKNQLSVRFIFHFASPASPPHYQKLGLETLAANSIGLSHALNAADGLGARVIFASTSEIYGDPAVHPQPESYWGNVNSYGVRSCYDEAKRFGEALIFTHNLKHSTQHGLVRIFNTYGPRMNPADGRVIINLLMQAEQNQPLTLYGTGEQTRSFCYVDDLIAGITHYAQSSLTTPVNLGNDQEFTLLEFVDTLRSIYTDRTLQVTHLPLPQDDPRQRRPDLTCAKKQLSPWSPRVHLREGLLKMRACLHNSDRIPFQSRGRD